jgi:hypothetical protein
MTRWRHEVFRCLMERATATSYRSQPRGPLANEVAISAVLSAAPALVVIASGALSRLGAIAIAAVSVVPVVIFVRRAFRLSLEASRENVVVSNYWRTYRLDWADIRAVRVGVEVMGVIPAPAFLFVLDDGKSIRAQATPPKKEQQRTEMQALAKLAPADVNFLW